MRRQYYNNSIIETIRIHFKIPKVEVPRKDSAFARHKVPSSQLSTQLSKKFNNNPRIMAIRPKSHILTVPRPSCVVAEYLPRPVVHLKAYLTYFVLTSDDPCVGVNAHRGMAS